MTLTLISASSSVSGLAYTPTADGDSFILADGVTYGSNNSRFLESSYDNLSITLLGHAFSTLSGIKFSGDQATLHIGKDGSFVSHEPQNGNTAVFLQNENGTVTNYGQILAHRAIGIQGAEQKLKNKERNAECTI